MERLTTNNPQTNFQTLMNYAYAKDGRVCLRHADGQDEKDLCEYIASRSPEMCGGVTQESVMDGACMECDCPLGILNTVAIQAAELRSRLKLLEDILGDDYDTDHTRDLLAAKKNEEGFELYFDESEGVWKEHKKPFCTVEFPTEEDYKGFQKMVDFWNENHKEDRDADIS